MNTYSTPALGPHYRIELEEAKQDYQDGLLTATGLLYYAIGICSAEDKVIELPTPAVNNNLSTGQTCKILQDERTTMQEGCNIVWNEALKLAPRTDSIASSNKANKSPFKKADEKAEFKKLEILDGSSRDKKVYEAVVHYDLFQAYGAARHQVTNDNWQLVDGEPADNAKILAATKRSIAGGVQ